MSMVSFIFVLLCSVFSFAQQANIKASFVVSPFGDFTANIAGIKGSATMNGTQFTAKNVTADLNTFSSGNGLRDTHAKDKYLEVKKFPTVELLEASGSNGKGVAKIKMKDKIQSVEGTYKIIGSNQFIQAAFNVELSKFGIDNVNHKGMGVEDKVKIEAMLPITKSANGSEPVKAANSAEPAKSSKTNSK